MSIVSSTIGDSLTVPSRRLSPTDISQYLRLHERNAGRRFLTDYDVAPQSITPLLTASGADFARAIEEGMRTAGVALAHFGETSASPGGKRLPDNARFVAQVRAVPPGAVCVVCQPRFEVTLGGWSIRGDADLVRVERAVDGSLHLLVTDMKSSTAVSNARAR